MSEDHFTPAAAEWVQPSAAVAANARVPDYEAARDRALQDIEAFWAERAATLDWGRTLASGARPQRRALLPLVHRRENQHRPECP